jgi:methylmalonyl-CoA mutase N-terminal domain/subunit
MTVILTLIGLKIMDSLPHLSFERFAEDELFYEFGKFRANCTVS